MDRWSPSTRRLDLVRAAVGAAVFVTLTVVVIWVGLFPGERATFTFVNELPDWLLVLVWPIMQAGGVAAVFVTGCIAALLRDGDCRGTSLSPGWRRMRLRSQ